MPLKLHIGGTEPREGWKILNIQPGVGVDFVGSAHDLRQFPDASVEEIYASHIYEHLSATYMIAGFREAFRVLIPGGIFRFAVPDLDVLCSLFIRKDLSFGERTVILSMIYGGQTDPHDFHFSGLNWEIASNLIRGVGFSHVEKLPDFGLFNDTTTVKFDNIPISLCVRAVK